METEIHFLFDGVCKHRHEIYRLETPLDGSSLLAGSDGPKRKNSEAYERQDIRRSVNNKGWMVTCREEDCEVGEIERFYSDECENKETLFAHRD